jgi:FKBP-type peptidyl-prolyl cis-trans isomerase FkpA
MKLLKQLLFLVAISLYVSACTKDLCKDVDIKAPDSEITTLETYLNNKGIVATKDARGFYYKITNAGNATKPTVCNKVTVAYVGTLPDGTIFEKTNIGATATFSLGQLIIGWQEGIPLIGEGGKITLYLPPTLAYGSAAVGNIPANSILTFDIDLVSVQ